MRLDAGDAGAVLLTVLLVMALVSVLTCVLAFAATTERRIAAVHRAGEEALYAADSAARWGASIMSHDEDWRGWLDGAHMPVSADGVIGLRVVPDGTTIDLGSRASGPGGSSWPLLGFGPLDRMLGVSETGPMYVVIRVGRGAGDDTLVVRAESYGVFGVSRLVDITLRRVDGRTELVSWRQPSPASVP